MKKKQVLFLFLLFLVIVNVMNIIIQPEGKYIGAGEVVKISSNLMEIKDGEQTKKVVLTKNKKKLHVGDRVEAWGYRWSSQEEIYGATYVKKERRHL